MLEDECDIDVPVFARFTDTLLSTYARSNHTVLRALLEGFLATAMVLVERGGGELPAARAHSQDPEVAALRKLSGRLEKAMPR
jgi:hypothetical protein